jgi:hypothetical protein
MSGRRPSECVAPLVEFKAYDLKRGRKNAPGLAKAGYALRFDYDAFLVALVKKLPLAERYFDVKGKWWWLTAERAEFVAYVARTCGYAVTGIEAVEAQAAP